MATPLVSRRRAVIDGRRASALLGGATIVASVVACGAAPPVPSAGGPPVVEVEPSVRGDPPARRVVVWLPFLSKRASVDGVWRDFAPAVDVFSFAVDGRSGPAHHVVAIALDETIAEGEVRESGDGVARPVAPFALTVPKR